MDVTSNNRICQAFAIDIAKRAEPVPKSPFWDIFGRRNACQNLDVKDYSRKENYCNKVVLRGQPLNDVTILLFSCHCNERHEIATLHGIPFPLAICDCSSGILYKRYTT